MSSVEECIQIRKEAVALLDSLSDDFCILFSKKPWFSTLGVLVGMTSEERLECSSLIPSNQ